MKVTPIVIVIIAFFHINPLFAFVAPTTTLFTAPLPITSQFHSQDSFGQYSYGYNGGPSIKTESKTLDGITRGSYSYIDPDGKLQTVEYTADALNGFRASGTNLPEAPADDKLPPEPVQETPEVAKARAEHLAAYKEAEIRAAKYPEEPLSAEQNDNSAENGVAKTNGVENNSETVATVVTATQSPLELTAVQSIPATVNLKQTPAATTKVIELPSSSYSYRIESSPIHGYNVLTPSVIPLSTAYTISSAPTFFTNLRPFSIATRILSERNAPEILRH